MAKCPHCQTEYEPTAGQTGCQNCGNLLTEAAFPQPDPISEINQDGSEPSTGNNKVINVGPGQSAGRDININQTSEYCAVGTERLYGDRQTYRCSQCGVAPVCEDHFDATKKICHNCVRELIDGPTVACGFCGDRIPLNKAFTCPRCLKICGPDHKSPTRDLCQECQARWDLVVEDIEDEKVGIGPGGTVVTREDVALKDGVIRDKQGHTVATIKKQTWYVRKRQWHTVKPQLLRREQQAMFRLYPNMEMEVISSGDIIWQGPITTWTQNNYEVQLRYPASFPFAPPRVFVNSPKITKSRHIYEDGHLCLFHQDDKAWQPRTTAATVMSWASLWLHCYEVWQETGNWPRPEADEYVITPSY